MNGREREKKKHGAANVTNNKERARQREQQENEVNLDKCDADWRGNAASLPAERPATTTNG